MTKFDPQHIEKHFKNLHQRPYHTGEYWSLYKENKGDIAEIFYMGKGSWHIIIDNFPGQRKHYHTDFPIKTEDDFINEMRRIGLEFEKT